MVSYNEVGYNAINDKQVPYLPTHLSPQSNSVLCLADVNITVWGRCRTVCHLQSTEYYSAIVQYSIYNQDTVYIE